MVEYKTGQALRFAFRKIKHFARLAVGEQPLYAGSDVPVDQAFERVPIDLSPVIERREHHGPDAGCRGFGFHGRVGFKVWKTRLRRRKRACSGLVPEPPELEARRLVVLDRRMQ